MFTLLATSMMGIAGLHMRSLVRPKIRCTPFMEMNSESESLAALRRSYYANPEAVNDPIVYNSHSALHALRGSLLGMRSLPAMYSDFPLLPQSQHVLDVWQRPDAFNPALEPYIAMFESLLQTEEPWLYVHATTLNARRARAAGTLMRVVNTKRTSDGRLQVLVQGLGKMRILNETRSAPFPRADVQLQVDAEAILHAETAILADTSTQATNGTAEGAANIYRMCLASALARDSAWRTYDAAGFDDEANGGGIPGRLVPFNTTVGTPATHSFAEAAAVRAAAETRDAWSEAGAASASADDEYSWDGVCHGDWFMDVAEARAEEAAAEQERCMRNALLQERTDSMDRALSEIREVGIARLEELEMSCWIELDALLGRYAALNAQAPPDAQLETPRVPTELLDLLPHQVPPSLGPAAAWPDDFGLFRMRDLLRDASRAAGASVSSGAGLDPAYPSWRRAWRLSYALSVMLTPSVLQGRREAAAVESEREMATMLQELLEAASASDRLRLVIRRLRDQRMRLMSGM